MTNINQLFSAGLKELNLSLDLESQQKLLDFLQFLQKWNRHYNLTAITDLPKMVGYHLLDSLSIVPYIQGENILDVGSGAGFPGIPLAVYFPQKQWTLLDSNGKKTRFLIQAKAEFNLSNIEIVHARVEQWRSKQKFDTIITRAVGPIQETMTQTQPHLQAAGKWLFMKGDIQSEELPAAASVHTLNVPGVSAARHLIVIAGD